MPLDKLPGGSSILHPDWPAARFNLSGLFAHDPLLFQLVLTMESAYQCRLPVEAMHGAPATPWNAGRLADAPFDLARFRSVLDFLNARGIGFFPTFSNHFIDERDLADPVGNTILECLAQRGQLNGVIVASDRLSNHIAQRYPNLKQIASVIKVTLDRGQGRPDYYHQLGQRFHRYVVHPDDGRNPKLLEQLEPEKAEILVNENCGPNCPHRARHYDGFARLQQARGTDQQGPVEQELQQLETNCRCPNFLPRLPNRERSCNLTMPELKAAYDLGFRHFKLQGRANDPFTYAFDLTRYMLEPIFIAPLVFKAVCRWMGGLVETRSTPPTPKPAR